MPLFRYERASIVVYDSVAQHRNATRMALYSLGFGKVSASDTLESLNRAIKYAPPDLVLCEASGVGTELCELIQTLRLGVGGHANPFLVVIVTAWEKSRELAQMVVNSGADDLILRPYSTTILKRRIDSHIERRKGFVITHNYVGPDRRNDSSRPANAELFRPPNSLKMKTMDGLTMPEANFRLQQELRRAKSEFASERLTREVFQICILWRILQDGNDLDLEDHLVNLGRLATAAARRCRAMELEAALQWCDSVVAAVEGLHFGVDRSASMHLLGQAAVTLYRIVSPERPHSVLLQSIDTAATTMRARAVINQKPSAEVAVVG